MNLINYLSEQRICDHINLNLSLNLKALGT